MNYLEMKCFEIWCEGYECNVDSSAAVHFGHAFGINFKIACLRFAESDPNFRQYFRPKTMSWWGCRLFDNEEEARKSFG